MDQAQAHRKPNHVGVYRTAYPQIVLLALLAALAFHVGYIGFLATMPSGIALAKFSFGLGPVTIWLLPFAIALMGIAAVMFAIPLPVSLFAAMLLRKFAHLSLSGKQTLNATLFVTAIFVVVGAPTLALTVGYFPPHSALPVVAMDLAYLPASRFHARLWPEWFLVLFLGASLVNAYLVVLVLERPSDPQRAGAIRPEVPDDGNRVRSSIPAPAVPPVTSTQRATQPWSARQWRMPRPRTAFQWIGVLTLLPIVMTVIGAVIVAPLGDCRPVPTCEESPHLAVRLFMMLQASSTIGWPVALVWLPFAIFFRWKRKRPSTPAQR